MQRYFQKLSLVQTIILQRRKQKAHPHLSAYIPRALIYRCGRDPIWVHFEIPVCHKNSVNDLAEMAFSGHLTSLLIEFALWFAGAGFPFPGFC